jgi:DNA segregation ATPase FtsK/SpoIIIE-like protein
LVADGSLYEVLGVAPTAAAQEIKTAYRNVVQRVHPDNGGPAALFRVVQGAYETLSDPARRAAYDSLIGPVTGYGQPPVRQDLSIYELVGAATELVVRSNLGSTALLQRKLRIDYQRALYLMNELECLGVVGPPQRNKARRVLLTVSDLDAQADPRST